MCRRGSGPSQAADSGLQATAYTRGPTEADRNLASALRFVNSPAWLPNAWNGYAWV